MSGTSLNGIVCDSLARVISRIDAANSFSVGRDHIDIGVTGDAEGPGFACRRNRVDIEFDWVSTRGAFDGH